MANINDIKDTDWIGFVYGTIYQAKWVIVHCKDGTFVDRSNREYYEHAKHYPATFTSQISLLKHLLKGLIHVYRFPDEETMLEWLSLKEE